YDDWYADVSDVAATVACIAELAGLPGDGRAGDGRAGNGRAGNGRAGDGPMLELGVGTGRLALPLAERGLVVHGIDASTAMLDRLQDKDPDGSVVVHVGDMVDDLPPGPFAVALVAYNTLFNLTGDGRQAACFAAVADRLMPGGRFVVEAFAPDVPDEPDEPDEPLHAGGHPTSRTDDRADGRVDDRVTVRSLTTDRVVLSVSVDRPHDRIAEGQFVELSVDGGVRMRPWMVRYATPDELDAMAAHAGFELEHRWRTFAERSWDPDDDRHVSIYRLVRS
ncbi:MAG: class I SAM-dependent methyltransferase, partial [Ilumatobacteraceae bacterium]